LTVQGQEYKNCWGLVGTEKKIQRKKNREWTEKQGRGGTAVRRATLGPKVNSGARRGGLSQGGGPKRRGGGNNTLGTQPTSF